MSKFENFKKTIAKNFNGPAKKPVSYICAATGVAVAIAVPAAALFGAAAIFIGLGTGIIKSDDEVREYNRNQQKPPSAS